MEPPQTQPSAFTFDRPRSAGSDSGSGSGEEHETRNLNSPMKAPKSPVKPTLARLKSRTGSSASSAKYFHAGGRTVYTSGRPPWYDSHGLLKEAFVIGLCGGSASGKTTVARKIIEALDVPWVSLLSMDSFYKVLGPKEHERAEQNEYNFDHPDAFDFDLLIKTLRRLKEGKKVEVPIYNFVTHSREKHSKTIYGANVVIFEGIMSFVNKDLLNVGNTLLFLIKSKHVDNVKYFIFKLCILNQSVRS
ncbi:uridine-cytidine kinase-like 1 [Saccostrea cucullata]|uniref:uridine-cytidine kinase-like 1 n=1 Tax=Saccostrea cuccullata TaxID=36930 RepID=UPI002ED1EDF3